MTSRREAFEGPTDLGGAEQPSHPTDVGSGLHEHMVDVFAFTVERRDDAQTRWHYCGPNSATVFGRAVDPRESLLDLIHSHLDPEQADALDALLTALSAVQPWEAETRIEGDDGVPRWVSWRLRPRVVSGIVLFDGVATDVSARHELDHMLRDLADSEHQSLRRAHMVRSRATALRDANDSVLQRIFAAGLRLSMLQATLGEREAHAASAIAFHLDQAASDLRNIIGGLEEVIELPLPGDDPDTLSPPHQRSSPEAPDQATR